MRIFLSVREHTCLSINGRPTQDGAAHRVVCAKSALTLKTMLQTRRELGVDTHALFVYLMKSRDIIKHEVKSLVLKK